MHIADGYLSPITVIATFALATPLWIYGFKKLKKSLDENTLPLLGTLSALSFVVMMFNIPIPGGTSGHAIGATLVAIILGPWEAYIAVSLVLLIQAVVFGDGGISTVAMNSLAMAFITSFSGYYIFYILKRFKFAPFIAGYIAMILASFVVAIVLGIQPLFWSENGQPLYFPFGLSISIPAVVGGNLIFGLAEGLLTQIVYKFLKKENNK